MRARTSRILALLALAAATATNWAATGQAAGAPTAAGPTTAGPTGGAPRRLAIFSTPGNGTETYLHLAAAGQPLPPPVATLHHLRDAALRGAVLPDGTVLAVADHTPGRDRSFGSALFRLEAGAEPVLLCDRVVFASRPLVAPDGRVFVQRGEPGPAVADRMREDDLSIDEVDPRSGAVRTVWRAAGYIAFLAAAYQDGLVVYHVAPAGARLLFIQPAQGAERTLLPSLPPYASDFSITAAGDLVFQERDPERRPGIYTVERLGISTGKRDRLAELPSPVAPAAWPHGEVTWNPLAPAAPPPTAPPGGAIEIMAFAPDGTVAAGHLYPMGIAAPDVVLLEPGGRWLARIASPPHTRLDVVGFLP